MRRKWQPLSNTPLGIIAPPLFALIKHLIPILLFLCLNINHSYGATLTVNLSGTGQGSVNSSPPGIACPGSCTSSFSTVNLFQNPADNSLFTGWAGACLGMENCSLDTSSDITVKAIFELKSSPYKVSGSKYGALQGAYNSVAPNGKILAAMDQAGDLILDKAINITLEGGFDSSFTGNEGNRTKLAGKIFIRDGRLAIKNVVLTQSSPAPPAAPSGIFAPAGDGQIFLGWSPVPGATSYNIYYSTSPGVTRADGIRITGATSGQAITGLTNDSLYFVVVTAINGNGEGPESAQVMAVPSKPLTHGYYKTEVGSQNSYVSGRLDTITSNIYSRLFLQVDEAGSSTVYWLTVTGNAIAIESMREYDTSGNFTGQLTFSPGLKIFPSATAVGTVETQTVTTTAADNSTSIGSCTLTVMAKEPVTLASGITYQNTLKIKNSCTDDISWFAPGVGQVKVCPLPFLESTCDQLGTPPAPPVPPVPAALVGTWSTSYSYHTFKADGTFYFGSLFYPSGDCIYSYKTQIYKYGNANVSGNSITFNVTGGQIDTWNCYVPRDGSPNTTKPVTAQTPYTKTWTIFRNAEGKDVLKLDSGEGGAYSVIDYTKD